MTDNILARFIRTEMLNRDMNQIEFAALLDVSPSTVGRMLRGEIKDPSLDFLVKLSNAAKIDICSLIHLIRPDAFQAGADTGLIAERIKRLPKQQRKLVEMLLSGAMFEGGDEGGNEN